MKKQYINEKFPHFLHGADYNPDQWSFDKSIWDEDMRLMKEANCNEMTVGIFAWATLEPREGEFDFSYLDEIIDKIYANGGRVVLATPSGARPHWMAEKYPEVLRVNKNGEKMMFGVRHNHCFTSPVYREKVTKINTLLAERYGKHPAVVAWHLSNEYGGECFCPNCQAAFREFVREKYNNDIDALNMAYWSNFWSHRYDNFEQIEPPMERGEASIHGLNLDWRRFVSHQTKDFIKTEIAPIKRICPDIPVTTNLMPAWRELNYADYTDVLDFISWDTYPDWHKPEEHHTQCYVTAFWHDFFRSLKQRPFMLMERAPGVTNWKPINKLNRPGMDRLASLQAVAHGSDTVQYFQFRKSRGSVEKFHGAIVDHVGTSETRIFKEVQATGATLKAIDEVVGTMPNVRVAIIHDWENRWALEDCQYFQLYEKKYCETCYDYYRVLWERAIPTDIVSRHADLSKYDLVIAPMLYMTDDRTTDSIEQYVKNGGTFYATYMLGMVNDTDLCHLGGFPGGKLKDVFGIWNEEVDTLYPGEISHVRCNTCGEEFEGMDYCELLHLRGAESLVEYTAEFYAGRPAVTRNTYGKGRAYYQAFRDDGKFKDKILSSILNELGIQSVLPVSLPHGVTATERTDGKNRYLFVQNFSGTPLTLPLDKSYFDLEAKETVSAISMEAYDMKILKE